MVPKGPVFTAKTSCRFAMCNIIMMSHTNPITAAALNENQNPNRGFVQSAFSLSVFVSYSIAFGSILSWGASGPWGTCCSWRARVSLLPVVSFRSLGEEKQSESWRWMQSSRKTGAIFIISPPKHDGSEQMEQKVLTILPGRPTAPGSPASPSSPWGTQKWHVGN